MLSSYAVPMKFAGRAVFVTGGAGFIGSHIVHNLLAQGASQVTIFDNLSTGFRALIPDDSRVTFVQGDLLDQALLTRAMKGQEFVFHMAANADIKDNLTSPRKCVDQNIVATQNVLEAMRQSGVECIAFASTGSVYGESETIPTPEDAPMPIQTSIYATSKVAAEGLLTSYALGFGFRSWIFRFVSILGRSYSHGHVIDFHKKLRDDPTRLEVLGDGHQKKSYLHVQDCINGILLAIDRQPPDERIAIYNLGHEDWIEVNDSVRIICRELGVSPTIEHAGGVRGWVGDSPKILLATDRIRSLGWAPAFSIEASLIETVRSLEANPFLSRRPPPSPSVANRRAG
jgi:UDP-glucose 4-epimerase